MPGEDHKWRTINHSQKLFFKRHNSQRIQILESPYLVVDDKCLVVHISDKLCKTFDDYPDRLVGCGLKKLSYRDTYLTIVERHYRRLLGDETLPDCYQTLLMKKEKIPFLCYVKTAFAFSDNAGKRFNIAQILTMGEQ